MLLLPQWAKSLDEATFYVVLRRWELATRKAVKPEQKSRYIRLSEHPWKDMQLEQNRKQYDWGILDAIQEEMKHGGTSPAI